MILTLQKKRAIKQLVVLDYITAVVAWLLFWYYRQNWLQKVHPSMYSDRDWTSRDYVLSFLIVPICWLLCYYLSGTYFDLYRKSRLVEAFRTFISSIIGCLTLGFIAFSNDVDQFSYFFEITSLYFLVHFSIVLSSRFLLLSKVKSDLRKGKVTYNTIIVGGNGKATKVFEEITNNPKVLGNKIIGFVNVDEHTPATSIANVPILGQAKDLEAIIQKYKIEEVVIAVESSEHKILEEILIRLSYCPVIVKVLPDLYDIISGSVKVKNFFQPVLISVHPELLPDWQQAIKRATDLFVACTTILVFSPLYLFAAIKTRLSSKGPIFYKQERIGLYGKPFYIIKFRSMYTDAEKEGPKLSSDTDNRITKWGKVMRKWRIDEIPQFFNIIKGDMSLVGPRPERQFFIDKIVATRPHYKYLHRVKPGLSSWGMVEYGYAENVDQMIERMKYDLLYIQNCSILLDWKIKIYTLKVVFQGRGK